MKPNKRLAAGLAGALAVAGVSVLALGGSPAQAATANYSGTQQIACHLYFGGGLPGTPAGDTSLLASNTITQIDSLAITPAGPQLAGTVLTVTLSSASGFANGPVGLNQGALFLNATAALSGAQSGTVALTSPNFTPVPDPDGAGPITAIQGGNYPAAFTAPGGSLGAYTLTGTFTATTAGEVKASLRTLTTVDEGGSGADNYCDGTAAGTTALPVLGNSVGNSNQTSNYSNDPDGNGFVTTGFKRTRLSPGAGGAIGWNSPLTWDPRFAPATSTSIAATIDINGPQANVTAITNPGADGGLDGINDTAIAAGTGGVRYFRSSDYVAVSGNNAWNATYPTNVGLSVCGAATPGGIGAPTCSPAFVAISSAAGAGAVAMNATGGQLNNSVTRFNNLSGFVGAYSLVVIQGTTPLNAAPFSYAGTGVAFAKAADVSILGTRTVAGPLTVSPGGPNALTGSNFYPGETVTTSATLAPNVSGAITNSLRTGGTATLTATNTFAPGDKVTVRNSGGNLQSNYVGTWTVTAATATDFSFALTGSQASTAVTAGAAATVVPTASLPGTSTATATGTGSFSASLVVNATTAKSFKASGIANGGVLGNVSGTNSEAASGGIGSAQSALFTVNADRCVAYTGNLTGGPGCATNQRVDVTVLAGQLTQRAYPSGINPSATVVDLGSIISPLATTTVSGVLNEITVSDNRGGTFGWSLTASMTNFTGALANTIPNSKLAIAPACAESTNASAYGYSLSTNDPAGTPIPGYDANLNAPGVTAGAGGNFGVVQNLCTKSTAFDAVTQSSGGVYNVTAGLTLTVDAFQAADAYKALMTITLA